MLPQYEKLITEIDKKTQWGKNEIKPFITEAFQSIESVLVSGGSISQVRKTAQVEVIKKYDLVYVQTLASAHYALVHKVIGDKVYCVILTSKDKAHSIHQIEKDRAMAGTFFSNTYMVFELEDVKKSFVRVYESKKEADEVFKKIKEIYLKALL